MIRLGEKSNIYCHIQLDVLSIQLCICINIATAFMINFNESGTDSSLPCYTFTPWLCHGLQTKCAQRSVHLASVIEQICRAPSRYQYCM